MNTIGTKLAAVGLVALATLTLHATRAAAGTGGSAAGMQAAIASGSTDAIIAEVERAEGLVCPDCVDVVTRLTEDPRYQVREVAAWWFAKRPALKDMMVEQMAVDLASGTPAQIRNAADFLGAVVEYQSLTGLKAAMARGDAGARLAIVHAVGRMAHTSGDAILTTAMADADPTVRAAAVVAWRDVLGQVGAQPAVALLTDGTAAVRAEAATVIGGLREASGRAALEDVVVHDADPVVRRNAAWALGQLGQAASRPALTTASNDPSGLVQLVAKAALAKLR
jgi:HEAT repeat protein